MIYIKRLISILLVVLILISCLYVPAAAAETSTDSTNPTLDSIFDNPIGTGILGNSDKYLYVSSPFDPEVSNVYFSLGSGKYERGYIDSPNWLILFDSQGNRLYLLVSDYPLRAKSASGAHQYLLIEPYLKTINGGLDHTEVADKKIQQFVFDVDGYSAMTSNGRVEINGPHWRQQSDLNSFVYSRDDYDTVTNFRASSHDIYYWGTLEFPEYTDYEPDPDDLIYPATSYSPVIEFGSKLDSLTSSEAYQESLGELISNVFDSFDYVSSLFEPFFTFLGEFWDEYVIGFLRDFLDNFTYYFQQFAIPDVSFFEEHFDNLYYGLATKFPILNDISDMYAAVQLAFENADNTPDISFTYQGQKYNLLNLELFDPVMPWVHSLILVFAYYRFLTGLYKKLPNMI